MDQFSTAESQRIAAAQPYVEDAARSYSLEPSLINGIIWVESRFEPNARSKSGARGLMQLMPATGRELAKRMGEPARLSDPAFNVRAGSYYLYRMLQVFDGDTKLALAAYNAGPGAIKRRLAAGEPLPERSERYVQKVAEARQRFLSAERTAARAGGRM